MAKFIMVLANAMMLIALLSFCGMAFNLYATEAAATSEGANQSLAWVSSCWTYGWGFLWGGASLHCLVAIEAALRGKQ